MHPSDTVLIMAAILAQQWGASDTSLAYAVCTTHRLIEMNERHEQWARAAYDSRFKSKWLPNGEPRDIQF